MTNFFSGLFTPGPGVVDGIFALSMLYVLAVWPLRKYLAPKEPFDKVKALQFFSGVVVLILAVATPLDHIGETYLFSVHMIQHVILLFLLPPLLILGTPRWLLEFMFRTEGLGGILKFLTKPIVAGLLFNFILLFWHLPVFYEFALRDDFVHLLEHVCFVGSGILMFLPLLDPKVSGHESHPGIKILYILGVSIGQIPLFAFLTFSTTVFYPTYAAAPRYFHDLSAIDDQILGGAIMKIVAVLFMVIGLVVYFFRWYEDDRK